MIGVSLLLALSLPGDTPKVLEVFKARCASCHGPNVTKPKGKFGYILDLKKLAANDKLIIPGDPAKSKLWKLVFNEDMPPEETTTGTLTEAEKATIKSWIQDGAKDTEEPSSEPPPPQARVTPPGSMPNTSDPPLEESTRPGEGNGIKSGTTPSPVTRTLEWLGKLHLLMLHFPIALAVAALLVETWYLVSYRWKVRLWGISTPPDLADTTILLILLAALFAIPTTTFGWLHGWDYGSGTKLFYHSWLGTISTLYLMGLTYLVVYHPYHVRLARLGLLLGTLLIGITAHFGGLMVHGSKFLDW